MNRALACVVLTVSLLASPSLLASDPALWQSRPHPLQFERVDDAAAVQAAVAALRTQPGESAKQKTVDPRAIALDWGLPSFLIPAAGNLQGSGGTYFRSDVTLANYRDGVDQEVLIVWIPRGMDGRQLPAYRTLLPSDVPPVTVENFVAELGLTGLGAILIFGVETGTTTPDEGAVLHGFSRIWTPQPGSAGTVSQPFPAQEVEMLTGEFAAVSVGLRQDANFRTNAGIVNLGTVARTFVITVFGENDETEFEMMLPPFSMQQVGIPAGAWGATTLVFQPADFDETSGWAAYGTSVDNVTGDGWVSSAGLPY